MKYLMINYSIVIAILFVSPAAFGKMKVITTTSTLRAVAEIVGADKISVESIAKGSQDPHYVEAKPSYMVKVRDADLVILAGLDLEIGWLPNVLQGGRNPKVQKGQKGYLEVGSLVSPLEIPTGKIDRAEGDVHPFGNPHFQTDPIRMGQVALAIAERLGQLDSENAGFYKKNADAWNEKLTKQIEQWKIEIKRSGVQKIITHHRTLSYFLNRFNLKSMGEIEDKPGIPPTANHILALISTIKEEKVPCILVESFFETAPAERIQRDVPIKITVVPTEVDATSDATTYEAMIENLVKAIVSCGLTEKKKT